jgi:hypothetical protein
LKPHSLFSFTKKSINAALSLSVQEALLSNRCLSAGVAVVAGGVVVVDGTPFTDEVGEFRSA